MTIGRIPSVEGGIQPTIVDAKGDILTATAADTPAVISVGSNGDTLLADSSATTGLRWQPTFAAGKNKIINGDFGIWQRGTSFSISADSYTSDRWISQVNGNGTRTVSQQTFTAGTAPVAGYEGTYFLRMACSSSGTATYFNIKQKIEDVRTFAGQTVTVSFWAKASASLTTGFIGLTQDFGSGGSGAVDTAFSNPTFTTSWARYTFTATVPSVSGKTIGTGSNLAFAISFGSGTFTSFDVWGVQIEAGSVATAFQTATGTLAGELAACQRYYVRLTAGSDNYNPITPIGGAVSTTSITLTLQPPVTLRAAASSIEYANMSVYGGASGGFGFLSVSSLTLTRSTGGMLELTATVSGATAGGFYRLQPNNAAGYVGVVAEL